MKRTSEMSLFTKRHYEWLAKVMHEAVSTSPDFDRTSANFVKIHLTDALEDDNPSGFNRQLFLVNMFGDPSKRTY